MKFSSVTYLIFEVNALVDGGTRNGITLAEARDHLDAKDLFLWLGSLGVSGLDIIPPEEQSQIVGVLQDHALGQWNRERKKYGVERNGLCYVIALLVEVLNSHFKRD